MTAPSRGEFVPDPSIDPLVAIFYSVQDSDVGPVSSDLQKGVIIVGNALLDKALRDIPSQIVATELDLLNTLVDLVLDLDPDVISGWEVQSSSWGYLGARGEQYGLRPRQLRPDAMLTRIRRSRHWGTDLSCLWTRAFE
jgi:DNA polymerase zeta